jgi:hypothetical protein
VSGPQDWMDEILAERDELREQLQQAQEEANRYRIEADRAERQAADAQTSEAEHKRYHGLYYDAEARAVRAEEALREIVRREGYTFTSWDYAAFAREALGTDTPEPREGMVMVYDSDRHYLGCMGIERWQNLLANDAAAGAEGEGA